MPDVVEFLNIALEFVRRAAMRALQIEDTYSEKLEAGGVSHVGDADNDNTRLAFDTFSGMADFLVVEEQLPQFCDWKREKSVIFVDPLDGTAEVGSGGSQFAAAVTLYGPYGVPLAAAAACPGLRPVYRDHDRKLRGFANSMGALLFGTPSTVSLLPIFPSRSTTESIIIPSNQPIHPSENRYTSIALDLNYPAICGLGSRMKDINIGLARMSFSNIFAQCQVIMGHANAMTLGPSITVNPERKSGKGISGPKAWDILLPLTLGVGLQMESGNRDIIRHVTPDLFLDSFVMNRRFYLSHPDVVTTYMREIDRLTYNIASI